MQNLLRLKITNKCKSAADVRCAKRPLHRPSSPTAMDQRNSDQVQRLVSLLLHRQLLYHPPRLGTNVLARMTKATTEVIMTNTIVVICRALEPFATL